MVESADQLAASAASHPGPALSVVAPCFNEEEVLVELHRRVSAACRAVAASYEIVLVDDGSTDATWSVLSRLAEDDPCVVAVKLSRNHGQALALAAGLSVCRGERVLVIDADLQDPPELLPELLARMNCGADVVYGQRRRRAGENPLKVWAAAVFYRVLNRLSDTPVPLDTGDFRLISRRVCDVLLAMPERHRFTRGMVSWMGFRQEPLLFDRAPRFAGRTKWPFRKRHRLARDALIACSTWPPKLAYLLGLVVTLAGLVLALTALLAWALGRPVPGAVGILGGVALLGGVQLLVLGVLGEYLGRIYEQSCGRPLFIIEAIQGGHAQPGTVRG